MEVLPRHVICVLGKWKTLDGVRSVVSARYPEFQVDEEYSTLMSDSRMLQSFQASACAANGTIEDEDWDMISSHSSVVYILSPSMKASDAESVSGQSLLLVNDLFESGALAAKSESAGLAHGRQHWRDLARRYAPSLASNDTFEASSTLFWTWVQRLIHDTRQGLYYTIGMHLLGYRDIEIADDVDPNEALKWVDLLGLYLVADKPSRPIEEGEGFRLSEDSGRRIFAITNCDRYERDTFSFNPYGYYRLDEA